MKHIKHKRAFFIIGVLLLFYFGLPLFDEFIYPLGIWFYETDIFNIAFVLLKISMLLVNDMIVSVVVQAILYFITWFAVYFVIEGIVELFRK